MLAIPPTTHLEADLGLNWLFQLRGPRPVPQEVIVVTIDKASSEHFGLPNVPRKWPRKLHAQLIEQLHAAGAGVIVFDMHFRDPQHQDQAMAQSIAAAGNVLLFEYLEYTRIPGPSPAHVERRLPPQPELANAALATAPFTLPKTPRRIGQAWLFKPGGGDVPTLPMVALHHSLVPDCRRLRELIRHWPGTAPIFAEACENPDQALDPHWLATRLRSHLLNSKSESIPPGFTAAAILERAHRLGDSIYLDFFGPPRSITTLPYHQVLAAGAELDMGGKAVFVGFSEHLQPEQKDSFYTAFSNRDGLDISGVEIMATTFANLLEQRSIKPLGIERLAISTLFAIAVTLLLYRVTGWALPLAALLIGAGYLSLALWLFSLHALWLPLVTPLLIQLPAMVLLSQMGHYRQAQRGQTRLRSALERYLPPPVVTAATGGADDEELRTTRFAVCLTSDAANYTGRGEGLSAAQLHRQLNHYLALIFTPIARHEGQILDAVGDSVLAIWSQGSNHENTLKQAACKAAREIQNALNNAPGAFETRIGLHCGEVSIGNVGSDAHLEYRAVGDTVNTASRIEVLNKALGTRILASEAVAAALDELTVREVGHFRLRGKSKALRLFEILPAPLPAPQRQTFSLALNALYTGQWQRAGALFEELLRDWPNDGPARYYQEFCARQAQQPSAGIHGGIIDLDSK